MLRRCLEKERKRRIDSAADARLEIDDALGGSSADAELVNRVVPRSRWRNVLPWAIATAALAIAGALAATRPDRVQPAPVHAFLDVPAGYVLGDDDPFSKNPTRTPMVFMPDGRTLVILATHDGKSQLFLRSLDRPDLQPIAGTDAARGPFASPDGKWIGFWSQNELKKVPIDGGAVTTICPLAAAPLGPFGAAWGPGGVIVFGDVASGRIMRVQANGGTPVAVTAQPPVSSRRRHVAPVFLPDGRRIIFADASTQDASDSRLMVQALDGGDARLVVSSATDPRLLPSGDLAFMRLATLMTMPFDAGRAEASGDAIAVMRDVMQTGTIRRAGVSNPGLGMFAVSSLGTLAAIRGGLTGAPENTLVWRTMVGEGPSSSAEPAMGAPVGTRMNARIAPDQSRAIVTVFTPMRQEMWLADWTRNVWTPCSDCSGDLGVVVWSPDGRRLLLGRDGGLVAHTLDGSVPDQVLVHEADRSLVPAAWLAGGAIAYMSSPDLARYEIKFLELGASAGRMIVPLGAGTQADVSRDGQLLAYATARVGDAAGNVIVQRFQGEGARIQVSAGGGSTPLWAPNGRTLYYQAPSGTLMAADVSTTGGLTASTPRQIFFTGSSCFPLRCDDLSLDGQRLLMRGQLERPLAAAATRDPITRMDLVLNWTATIGKGR